MNDPFQPQASSSKLQNGIHLNGNGGGPPSSTYGLSDISYVNDYSDERRRRLVQIASADPDAEWLEEPAALPEGNWGKKMLKGAQFVRKGKLAAWGPTRGEWEVEERARKRLRGLLPRSRSPSPPTLSHLREESPPTVSPYLPPSEEHTSCSTFVLDPAMAHSFRTHLLEDLQQTTDNLIEGETTLKRALGRLFVVLAEEHNNEETKTGELAKREDMDETEAAMMYERERRFTRFPSSDLSPSLENLFLTHPNGGPAIFEPSQFGSPQMQLENLEKALNALHELSDDSREYVERLGEIREDLGDVRRQRSLVWTKVRENALEELKELKEAEANVE